MGGREPDEAPYSLFFASVGWAGFRTAKWSAGRTCAGIGTVGRGEDRASFHAITSREPGHRPQGLAVQSRRVASQPCQTMGSLSISCLTPLTDWSCTDLIKRWKATTLSNLHFLMIREINVSRSGSRA